MPIYLSLGRLQNYNIFTHYNNFTKPRIKPKQTSVGSFYQHFSHIFIAGLRQCRNTTPETVCSVIQINMGHLDKNGKIYKYFRDQIFYIEIKAETFDKGLIKNYVGYYFVTNNHMQAGTLPLVY